MYKRLSDTLKLFTLKIVYNEPRQKHNSFNNFHLYLKFISAGLSQNSTDCQLAQVDRKTEKENKSLKQSINYYFMYDVLKCETEKKELLQKYKDKTNKHCQNLEKQNFKLNMEIIELNSECGI